MEYVPTSVSGLFSRTHSGLREERKRRSPEEKLQIVRETLQSHESVAVIARRHAVNANQVFAWRR
jgi:transposase